MRSKVLVLLLAILSGLAACNRPDDGPRHLTPEEIEKYKQEQTLKIEKYVEYREGNCPVILTVPHGGTIVESFLTLRNTSNCPDPDFATDLDYNTRELADEIDKAFYQQTGRHPYMIISLIKRNHVDFNRKRSYAIPAGDENIGKIYDAYHAYVTEARNAVSQQYGHGLLLDIHGQSHSEQIDLGYLLPVSTLDKSDRTLNSGTYAASSSIAYLTRTNKAGLSFAQLLRGEKSFGSILYKNGLECVPRPGNLSPGSTPYFYGGYTTRQYGSYGGGVVDAIQCEFRYSYRDTYEERVRAAAAFAKSVTEFTAGVW
jgi:N-formylglutamate amidohydrolase